MRKATVYPDGKVIAGDMVKHEPNAITSVVSPKNPVVADIPMGQLLEYLGWDMDDVMSVIRDAVCDRPLAQLRMDYPGLEEVIKRVVGVE
jgi:hypothetical protein